MSKARCNYKIDPISALDQLTEREKQVLAMRLGVGKYNRAYTLKEIGEIIKSTLFPERAMNKERVRQIEAKALRKLRHPSRNCKVLARDEIMNNIKKAKGD